MKTQIQFKPGDIVKRLLTGEDLEIILQTQCEDKPGVIFYLVKNSHRTIFCCYEDELAFETSETYNHVAKNYSELANCDFKYVAFKTNSDGKLKAHYFHLRKEYEEFQSSKATKLQIAR